MHKKNVTKKALIMVDLQNDFCSGGSLAVNEGELVVPLANQLQPCFDMVIATQDWHPRDHMSFAANHPGSRVGEVIRVNGISQVLWPAHCVQESNGAKLRPELNTQLIKKVFYKGTDRNLDSYSAFYDNEHLRSTGLGDFLRHADVENIYIMGLATDYCVKYSTLDALHLGFNVCVIVDACRGVELKPGDTDKAINEMCDAGAQIIHVQDVIVAK